MVILQISSFEIRYYLSVIKQGRAFERTDKFYRSCKNPCRKTCSLQGLLLLLRTEFLEHNTKFKGDAICISFF